MSKKEITIYDISKIAGVSPATISRAVHSPDQVREETKSRVWAAFREAGISPDELSFRSQVALKNKAASKKIPVVIILLSGWNNLFFEDVMEGVVSCLNNEGIETVISHTVLNSFTVGHFLEFARSLNTVGIIVTSHVSEDILYRVRNVFPVVQCSDYNPVARDIPYVTVDDYAISKEAVTRLIESGSRRPAFFSAPFNNSWAARRYKAYSEVLAEYHIPDLSNYVFIVADFSYERMKLMAGVVFTRAVIPDSVFCVSDMYAHAVMNAAYKNGLKVPGDIQIIGFDNTLFAELTSPQLTTILQPRRDIGTLSARILLKMIRGSQDYETANILPAPLIQRGSTKDLKLSD